ncbi:protein of unknown function [Pseudomonas sp. JV551A1]|uniref:Uncharacterized protein n=1 Tax=Pseudomonas inefficax TaxID=2078786 RepID=A0AAQ1PCH6_9PSED|nr:protein of unknown function [Pseudomonas sp. JV551A1]SPO61732.1 protein of unknown function [Pseudomonas inefficax]
MASGPCESNCLGYLFKPALALVGAALCRDGPQSGPDNLCCEAENLGPLRAPSRHKAAPTGIAQALGIEQGRCFQKVRGTDPAALQYIRKYVYSKKHIF